MSRKRRRTPSRNRELIEVALAAAVLLLPAVLNSVTSNTSADRGPTRCLKWLCATAAAVALAGLAWRFPFEQIPSFLGLDP